MSRSNTEKTARSLRLPEGGYAIKFKCTALYSLLATPARIAWCLAALCLVTSGAAGAGEIWVSVDTGQHALLVMEGDKTLRSFDNISIGRSGVTRQKVADDNKTPLGEYRVRRIKRNSRFHLYFGLDYPSKAQAVRASRKGDITTAELNAILRAHKRNEEPPADTPLGGNIGIHGLGNGDPGVHRDLNWTEGCVAMTDAQIEELAHWIGLGTVVIIR